jgi:hypothetical protein
MITICKMEANEISLKISSIHMIYNLRCIQVASSNDIYFMT